MSKHLKISFIRSIFAKAKKHPQRILFPEAHDDRVLKAADIVSKKKLANVVLLGDKPTILRNLKRLKISSKRMDIIDLNEIIHHPSRLKPYADLLYKKRKKKGLTLNQAKQLSTNLMYLSTLMLLEGEVDGIVAGASWPTAQTFIPALQLIPRQKGVERISSYFIMVMDKKLFFFADCAMNIHPDAKTLASTALVTAESARSFGITPKVAFLSFSTHGSARDPSVDLIERATQMVKRKHPRFVIDGELQLDAAIVPEVAKQKARRSPLKGDANILIFPDLASGNIAYKLVERLARALAIGPISQGLSKPVNDLSRGCSVEDIVEVAAITAIEAHQLKSESKHKLK